MLPRAMVTIGMNYRVLAGKEDTFESACERVLEVMKEAPGHDSSSVYRRVDSGAAASEYLIVSRWSDESAFQAFVASETFKKVTSWGLAHILAGRPSHTTYREG
jgi:heme-degrading monooxygenase HmoA